MKDIDGKSGAKSGVYVIAMGQYQFCSFDKNILVLQDVDSRGNWVRGIWELCVFPWQPSYMSKIHPK